MRLYPHSNLIAPRSLSKAIVVFVSLAHLGNTPVSPPTPLFRSIGNMSVTLSPPSRYPFLSLRRFRLDPSLSLSLAYRLAPTESVSLPLDRRLFRSPFHARSVSFSSLPRCPCLPPLIAPIYLLRVYLSFFPLLSFFLSHSLFLSHHVGLARSHGIAKFGRTHAATCLQHLV